jgi:hypothetical protein
MTCTVCYDPFTTTVRRPVPCASCDYAACTRCVKTYLLSTPADPHCMNCKHAWNREFIDTHMTRSWREGELKERRGSLLFDRERSLLPATQPAVEIERQKRVCGAEIDALSAEAAPLREQLKAIEAEIARRQFFIVNGRELGSGAVVEKEKRQFVAACPAASCRGFLSTAYKCGTCGVQFCNACREPKGDETDGHTCDPDLVATMTAIAKDTRGCPTCGTGISKVSGCDQMYCTECDTAFSWTTGKVVTGVIHNPHYYERMQKLKAGGAPRNPGDVPCGGWPALWDLRLGGAAQATMLRGLYQAAIHVEQVVLRDLATEARPTDNTDLRVRYLLQEIDEKRLQQLLQQRDRRRSRDLEVRAPLELFVLTVLEFFVEVHRSRKAPAEEAVAALVTQIREHVNEPLKAIGLRYKNIVPQISFEQGPRGYDAYKAAGWRPSDAI